MVGLSWDIGVLPGLGRPRFGYEPWTRLESISATNSVTRKVASPLQGSLRCWASWPRAGITR